MNNKLIEQLTDPKKWKNNFILFSSKYDFSSKNILKTKYHFLIIILSFFYLCKKILLYLFSN